MYGQEVQPSPPNKHYSNNPACRQPLTYESLLRRQRELERETNELEELEQLPPELAQILAAAAAAADDDYDEGGRRDSGVLVEDPSENGLGGGGGKTDVQTSSSTASTPTSTFPASAVVPMPALAGLDRLVGGGGRMPVNSR